MPSVIITAFLSFVSTNIDDIFILMILFAQAAGEKDRRRIIAGQYLGITVLTGISIIGAFGTRILPAEYVGMLGLIPILLGIKSWIEYMRRGKENEEISASKAAISITAVSLLTIANGADNIGVYIPVFSSYSAMELTVTVIVFVSMTALWCLLGDKVAGCPAIKEKIQRYQHILVPAVLVALGIFILLENYVFP